MVLQKEPSNYERQLVALGRALQAIREEETADGAIQVTLAYLQEEFDYTLTWLGLYDRTEQRLTGKGGSSATGETGFLKQRIPLNPGDLIEQVIIQQRPLGVPDLRDELRAGEWRKIAQRLNVQGTLILPIRHHDCCLGVVLLGSALWGTSPRTEEKARLSMLLGSLAEVLYHLDMEQQRRQTKHPDEPLLNVLPKLRTLPSLARRLEAVIDETHRFIKPDRTNIYWYEPQKRYFWRRLGNRDKATQKTEATSDNILPVQELGSFYQALAADQVVAVGEVLMSSLKAEGLGRLMLHLHASALIAAPILYEGELLGFLSIEVEDVRAWQDTEKNYMRGAAQLLALVVPLEKIETTIQQVKQDQSLTTEVSHALYSEEDWRNTLRQCADQMLQRLKAERFLVLLYDADLKKFQFCYQHQLPGRRPIPWMLDNLNPVDWQMLERSADAIGIENLQDDLKLMAWRQVFLDMEMRSLLICSTSIGKPIEGLIVIGHEATRSWNRTERDLLKVVSQQVGLLLHQFNLQTQTEQLQKMFQATQWSLVTMQQIQSLDRLDRSSIQHIAQLLQVPLATLITWQPGSETAKITAPLFSKSQFGVVSEATISIAQDPLIQWALQKDSFDPIDINEIGMETRRWLNGSEIGQVLVYTLRTAPEHEPTGILLLADRADRTWSQHQLSTLGILVNQLAWCRRNLTLTEMLLRQCSGLEQLNWYKHRRIEEIYQILGATVRRLTEMSQKKDSMASMRFQQVLRHLGNTLTAVTPLLNHEQWKLHTDSDSMPLASLLKRSLERLDGLIKQRQLWSQVHNEANVSIGGDVPKIEFIVHEILTMACFRSPVGSRLDIWCRPIDARWIEMLITDHGSIDPNLLEELETGQADLLAPSMLKQPPGLHLMICKAIMHQMGGEVSLDYLEDGRVLSRLVIPIAASVAINRSDNEISGFF